MFIKVAVFSAGFDAIQSIELPSQPYVTPRHLRHGVVPEFVQDLVQRGHGRKVNLFEQAQQFRLFPSIVVASAHTS